MSKTGKESKENHTTETGNSTEWETALQRAQSALQKNKIQAARLRAAIRLFSEKLSRGEPWPGSQA